MLVYACANIIEMVKGYIWPPRVYVEEVKVEEKEKGVKEVNEEPVKRYNLRERRPVDYNEN